MPPIPSGYNMPFYYSTITAQWIFFEIDPARARPYLQLRGPGLELYLVDDGNRAVVVLVFMKYASHFNDGVSVTLESELNLLTYPLVREQGVPIMSLDALLAGNDQTKTIGQLRLLVPASNPVAVRAGRELFGEPKFLADFTCNVPALNSPGVDTWTYTCFSSPEAVRSDEPLPGSAQEEPRWCRARMPGDDDMSPQRMMWSASADLRGLPVQVGNSAAVIRYTNFKGRPLASRWNLQGLFQTVLPGQEAGQRIRVAYGPDDFAGMRTAMQELIGDTPASAVQDFSSGPAGIESRGYYVDL